MGIFTGSEMLFFVLGVLATLFVWGLIRWHNVYNFNWYTTLLAATGIFFAVFTIAWWVSSIQEGEPQSANVGVLVFGLPVLILFGITRRLVTKKKVDVEAVDEG